MSIAVKATFPDEDEPLKPSGSMVQWTKAYQKESIEQISGEMLRRLRWVVPVTCGGCGKTHDVHVLRGLSREGLLTIGDLRRFVSGECAGYCRDCWLKHFRRNLKLPDGSEVFFTEWGVGGLPVFCGKCNAKRVVECDRAASFKEFTLHCPGCNHLIGMVEHPSGAKILWLDRQAVRKGQQSKVAFLCAACGLKHYAFPENTTRSWRGRDDACKRAAGDTKAVVWDMSLVETRSCVLYSQRDGADVPVVCGLPGCSEKNVFSFDYTRQDIFTGYCRKHPRREISAAHRAFAQNGNAQGNGDAETRRRGRRPGDRIIDYADFISDVKACASAELVAVKGIVSDVRQTAVLARYHHLRPGDVIALSTFKARLVAAGYNMKWSNFVELLAKEQPQVKSADLT